MALKAGSRSSVCSRPRSALGAQPRLWSGQTPKKEHTAKRRNPCRLSPPKPLSEKQAGQVLDEERLSTGR